MTHAGAQKLQAGRGFAQKDPCDPLAKQEINRFGKKQGTGRGAVMTKRDRFLSVQKQKGSPHLSVSSSLAFGMYAFGD